jgi:hypothetical protein
MWRKLDQMIEDVEASGYILEMNIQQGDDRSKDAQKRVRKHVQLVKELKRAKKTALELGI